MYLHAPCDQSIFHVLHPNSRCTIFGHAHKNPRTRARARTHTHTHTHKHTHTHTHTHTHEPKQESMMEVALLIPANYLAPKYTRKKKTMWMMDERQLLQQANMHQLLGQKSGKLPKCKSETRQLLCFPTTSVIYSARHSSAQ